MMKLSEAIRLGATMKPQARGVFMMSESRSAFGTALDVLSTCAFGAALDALGYDLYMGPCELNAELVVLWPFIAKKQDFQCPSCNQIRLTLEGIVVHLNDEHGWSRERIADFVELHEPIDCPEESKESPIDSEVIA